MDDLKILLEYLFYTKDFGNDMTNPNIQNYSVNFSFKENILNKDDDGKNNYKNDISTFTKNILNIFQNYILNMERNNNGLIMETFKKLNDKTTDIGGKFLKNNQDFFSERINSSFK